MNNRAMEQYTAGLILAIIVVAIVLILYITSKNDFDIFSQIALKLQQILGI